MSEDRPPYELDREQPAPVRRKGTPGITFPILLIGAGAVALLSNLGIIDVSWQNLARFWPVLLILLGIDVIFGRRSFAGSLAVGLAALALLGGILWISSSPGTLGTIGFQDDGWGQQVSGSIAEPLQSATELEVQIDLMAAELEIDAQSGKEFAAQGDYTTDSMLEPVVKYGTHGNTGELSINQPNSNRAFPWGWNGQNHVSVSLPTDIPIDLTINGDLGGQTLDLSKLNIRSLTIDNNNGALTVTLPKQAEMSQVDISADLGAITVKSPNGAVISADSIRIDDNSGAVTFELPSQGSLGDVSISADLGAITITAPRDASLTMRSFDVEDNTGAIHIELPPSGSLGDVSISADLGEIVVGVAGTMGQLRVDSLTVDNGSGAVTVTLPNQGDYEATISADLGGVTVTVPEGLEAHARVSTDLGSASVSNPRFNKIDDETWETAGFASAANRVELTAETSSGGVTVK